MKWREIQRFGLKKLPEPMLKDCFRSFAVTGEPVEAHLNVQRLVIVRQREPVDEGQVDEPRLCGAKFFQESFPKDEKVTSVRHVGAGILKSRPRGHECAASVSTVAYTSALSSVQTYGVRGAGAREKVCCLPTRMVSSVLNHEGP